MSATQVQLRKGTKQEHQSFIGAKAEVTYVDGDNALRVHDGATAGGTELAFNSTSKDLSAKSITVAGNILPVSNGTQDIGSPTNRFSAIYVNEAKLSTNTLYIGDTAILGTSQNTVQVHADPDQSISILTTGTGQTTIASSTKTQISTNGMNADVTIQASGQGSKVRIGATQSMDVSCDINAQQNVSVTGNVTISGNITVNGTSTVVNTNTLAVKDNIIDINSGETGVGVTAGTAGIKIKRGDATDMLLIFDETDDKFKLGGNGTTLETIATREWVSANSGSTTWSSITSKPTTISGFGITDAYTKTQVDTSLAGKANTATTLSGYGITDAYTKTQIDTSLSAKVSTTSLGNAANGIPQYNGSAQLDLGGKTAQNMVLANISEQVTAANSGTAYTVSVANGPNFALTLTGNCTLTVSGATASTAASLTLFLIQDATGSRTITWPASVKWAGGTAPTLTTTANKVDVISLVTYNGGTTWLGFVGGQNF